MKSIGLLFLVIFFFVELKAQIVYETTYVDADLNGGTNREFELVELDSSEFKYLLLDYGNSVFNLYNLDYTLFQTVNIPVVWANFNYRVHYISRSLFDCDTSNIEYLIDVQCVPQPCIGGYVKIYRTDGSELFSRDTAHAQIAFGSSNLARFPIISTPNGTKLLLDRPSPFSTVEIYSLCGTLPPTLEIKDYDSAQKIHSQALPNPASNIVTINYLLPPGENEGDIRFYDISGNIVKSYHIDNNFSSIIVSINDFPSGTYIYKIETATQVSDGEQLIIIED